MKAVAEIVAAIILLVSGSYIAPSLIKEFKVETIKKLDQGFSSALIKKVSTKNKD